MRLAIGRRPAPDVPEAEIIEVATHPALIRLLDAGGADVMVLDGEAQPAGGMGVCRQAKDEVYNCPPVLLIIGRADDGWLATWSRADAVVSHPIDPARRWPRRWPGLMRAAGRQAAPDRRASAHPGEGRIRPLHQNGNGLARFAVARQPGTGSRWPLMDSRTTWPALIGALIKGEHLAADETAWAMNEIMDGAATPAQIAGFGVALRIKGETAGEVTGLAQAMLDHASPISIPGRTVDLVGTGGDGARTVNISTMGTIVGRGRRRPDGQARQPGGLLGLRYRRRAGGTRRRH